MLPSGLWTSKMGSGEDIEHETLQVLEGKSYGHPAAFLRRKNALFQRQSKLKKLLLALRLRWESASGRT
jgi:hypothetical protein